MIRWISKYAISFNLCVALVLLVLLAAGSVMVRAEEDQSEKTITPSPATQIEEAASSSWQNAVKMFAAALAIGSTAFATAITQCRIGSAGVGALAENPKLFGNVLIFLVIPETMVILGFVIAALMIL